LVEVEQRIENADYLVEEILEKTEHVGIDWFF
jgi:hypothetical protein